MALYDEDNAEVQDSAVKKFQDSVSKLMEHAGGDYSGAQVCKEVLLAGWNSHNFPLDILRLSLLDRELGQAACNIVFMIGRGVVHMSCLPVSTKKRLEELAGAAYELKNNC